MPIPKVTVKLVDLTARVPSFAGVYGAMLIDAPMGPIDSPVLIDSEDKLLKTFTPYNKLEIGYSETFESAKAFLTRSDKLWMLRVVDSSPAPLLGGVIIQSEESLNANAAFATGYEDSDEIVANEFAGHPDSQFAIYAASPGDWSDNFSVQIVNHRFDETLTTTGNSGSVEPGVGDTLTVSISATTVDSVNERLTLSDLKQFATGDAVKVSGAAAITDLGATLTAGTIYYIGVNTGTLEISFYATKAQALTDNLGDRINLVEPNDPTPATLTITYANSITTSLTAVTSVVGNVVTLSSVGNLATGDAVRVSGTVFSPDHLGGDLAPDVITYVRVISTTDVSFHDTAADAVADTNPKVLTDTVVTTDTLIVESVIDVDITANTIQLDGIGTLQDGARVLITSAGTLPAPLTTGLYRYVYNTTGNLYTLHTTEADAITGASPVNITTVGDGSMEIEYSFTVYNDSVELTTNNWVTGEAVTIRPKTGGTLPAPLLRSATYYLIKTGLTNRYQFATSRVLAIAGTPIDLTTEIVGELVLSAADKVAEPGASEIRVFHNRLTLNGDTVLTPVETWTVSRNPIAKSGTGQNIFIENVLEQSLYIRGVEKSILDPGTLAEGEYPVLPQPTAGIAANVIYLAEGSASAPTEADYVDALAKFENPINFPLTVVMDGGYHNTAGSGAYERAIITLCENRGDCVGFFSTPIEHENTTDYLSALLDWRNDSLPSTSYGALYTPHLQTIDTATGLYKFVSPEGFAGAALSYMAFNQEIWFPLAGSARGGLPQASGVNIKFTTPEADILHDQGTMNPIMFVPGAGVRMVSQKTLLSTPSDLQNLNVRLLLVAIIPGMKTLLEAFLQEFNTEQTRARLSGALNAFLNDIRARQGIFAYQVVCDTSNNTDDVIDAQQLIVDIFLEPAKGINEIKLTVALVRTGGISDLQIRVA